MKSIKLLSVLFLLITGFCFAECRKHHNTPLPDNPYGLPNATQTGAGVFACRINGVNAIAKNDILHQGGGAGGSLNDTIAVKGSFKIGSFFATIYLSLQANAIANMSYNLSDTIHTYCFYVTDSTCQDIGGVTAIKPKIGSLIFTKMDMNNKVLSGTFSFKVPVPSCDTLDVTDGRFDIRY